MLISEVKAQETQGSGLTANGDFSASSFVPLILIFVIFYFLIIRPQSKKMKEHQALINAVKKGDKVITNSGIIGKITDIDSKKNIIHLEIAEDVVIQILRHNISEVVDSKKTKKDKKNKK